MKIAIQGCAHGELDKIYECITVIQERENIEIDLLICCGDFQSVRNNGDLRAMAVPAKYQHLCTFHKYYSGEKIAPILTIFIGGNHEASNYLQELPYGGWVAPNIYYLGRAGVVQFGNLRIGGLSGIFKGRDYLQGHWECPPYSENSLRSVYHIRSLDVFRLSQFRNKVDVMLTHDWPSNITKFGDKEQLLRAKPFFREDIESNKLGSPPAEKLLNTLKPIYWFAGHLHCEFVALVKHDNDEETKFLALDKCLPNRKHLQIVNLPAKYDGDKRLKFDPEWLAILKSTNHLLSVKNIECHMPGPGCDERYNFQPTAEEIEKVKSVMGELTINKDAFVRTAPVHNPNMPKCAPREPFLNPQTVYLCEKLGIDDPIQVVMARSGRNLRQCLTPHAEKPLQNSVLEDTPEVLTSFSSLENTPVQETPIKISKMSLPAPVTPTVNEMQDPPQTVDISSKNNVVNDNSDCVTPPNVTRKVFKRRNIALYTPDADDASHVSGSSLDSESPSSIKICKS